MAVVRCLRLCGAVRVSHGAGDGSASRCSAVSCRVGCAARPVMSKAREAAVLSTAASRAVRRGPGVIQGNWGGLNGASNHLRHWIWERKCFWLKPTSRSQRGAKRVVDGLEGGREYRGLPTVRCRTSVRITVMCAGKIPHDVNMRAKTPGKPFPIQRSPLSTSTSRRKREGKKGAPPSAKRVSSFRSEHALRSNGCAI